MCALNGHHHHPLERSAAKFSPRYPCSQSLWRPAPSSQQLLNSSLGPDYTVTIEVRGWEVISTKANAIPPAVKVEKPSSPSAAFVPTQREPNALPPSSESEAKPVILTRPKIQPSTRLVFYKTGKEVELFAPQYERVYWTFKTFKSLCVREAKRLYKLTL
jgi:hypothetical protein